MEAITKEKFVEDLKTVGHDVEDLVKARANRTDERITAARSRAVAILRNTHARLTNGTNEVTGFGFLSGYLLGRR